MEALETSQSDTLQERLPELAADLQGIPLLVSGDELSRLSISEIVFLTRLLIARANRYLEFIIHKLNYRGEIQADLMLLENRETLEELEGLLEIPDFAVREMRTTTAWLERTLDLESVFPPLPAFAFWERPGLRRSMWEILRRAEQRKLAFLRDAIKNGLVPGGASDVLKRHMFVSFKHIAEIGRQYDEQED